MKCKNQLILFTFSNCWKLINKDSQIELNWIGSVEIETVFCINGNTCYSLFKDLTEVRLLFSTWSPLDQTTVGAGSPVISTSRRSLFPATTMMVFWETMFPVVSKWIFGGSGRSSQTNRRTQRYDMRARTQQSRLRETYKVLVVPELWTLGATHLVSARSRS